MTFDIRFSRRSLKDLRGLQPGDQQRVLAAIERLRDHLQGDVKKLTAHTPEYRLRVGVSVFYSRYPEVKSTFTGSGTDGMPTPEFTAASKLRSH